MNDEARTYIESGMPSSKDRYREDRHIVAPVAMKESHFWKSHSSLRHRAEKLCTRII